MCDTDSNNTSIILCGKRLRSEHDMTPATTSINRGTSSSSSSSSRSSHNSTSSSCLPSLDSSWKTMYEDERTKNTMLNLQLCFVQSECLRLLNLQSDMANSIATLQSSLSKWIADVGSDDDTSDSDNDEDNADDDALQNASDDMSGSGTDEEDQVPKRPRGATAVHKQTRNHLITSITR